MNQNKDDRTNIRTCFRTRKLVLVHVMMCGGEQF